ncbi:gasdermin-D [Talpa occidentalis]|uniref:gasdermin-D n=1 Tax=Talpa occidentalis TaxID=50954 RepID=UPI00188FC34D|nr:gasdermin-D [Talpa occidentalis]XP_037349725.1 gasdermin-D [Talpa occidentalis]
MPSAFEQVVRNTLQELDCGRELVPVRSLGHSASFQPYCLLVKEPCGSVFWKPRFQGVELSIRDILEPDAPEPDAVQAGPFHFHDAVDGRLQGSVELAAPGQGQLAGEAAMSSSSSASMHLCLLSVPPCTWTALRQERRLRRPEPQILRQLRRQGRNLYVVTKALRTQREVEVTSTQKREGAGRFMLPTTMCLQGKGQGHLSHKRTITIPSGSILAFQPALLTMGSDWEVVLFPDKRQKTFGPPQEGFLSLGFEIFHRGSGGRIQSDAAAWGSAPAEDWQGLQAEVAERAKGLCILSGELCGQLRGGLVEVLPEEEALRGLEELLEQGLRSGHVPPQSGPVGIILGCLSLSDGRLVEELTEIVLYLLGALAALSDTQRGLLAWGLETRALQAPLSLVGSVLEQSTPWQLRQPVSLPAWLLGSSWSTEAPAWTLLEECGLELRGDAPHVSWEPEAQGQLCALYACLALLSRLGEAQ